MNIEQWTIYSKVTNDSIRRCDIFHALSRLYRLMIAKFLINNASTVYISKSRNFDLIVTYLTSWNSLGAKNIFLIRGQMRSLKYFGFWSFLVA